MYKKNISTTAKGIRFAATLALGACAAVAYHPAEAAFTTPWVVTSSWNPPHVGGTGNTQSAPTLADVNNDNLLDVLIGASDGNVYVFLNKGSAGAPNWGTTPDITVAAFSSTAGGSSSPAVADLNGDGLPDLLVGNRGLGRPTVPGVLAYVNDGSAAAPHWSRKSAWDITGLTGAYFAPALADLNGDGKVDLMLGQGSGVVTGYVNTGSAGSAGPIWTRITAWDLPNMTGSQSTPALADLDGDGDQDMMVGGLYGTVFAFRNMGTVTSPVWQAMGSWFVADPDISANNNAHPALGDLDGDGNVDLLYGQLSGNTTAYRNTGLPLTEPGTSPPPPLPGIHTATETFDNFTCAGAWQVDPSGPNTSYTRNCGNGWTAYALDSSNTGVAPPWAAGPVGDSNVVTLDNVNGPSAVNPGNPPLGSAQVYTAPTDSVVGELWLLKTFPVIPGQPIQTLSGDYRIKVNGSNDEYVGMVVFDGAVTRPPSDVIYTAGVPTSANVLASSVVRDGYNGGACGSNVWCAWHSASLGGQYLVPTHGEITVAFKVSDIRTAQTVFADFDNLTVSGVVTPAQSNVPVGDIAQLWKATYSAAGTNNMAEPAAAAIDANGNVYVAASTYGNGHNYDIVTLKYDPSGNLLWATPPIYDGGDADQATGISVDSSGNVYVTGRSFQGGSNDIVSLKYNSSGVQQWASVYDNGGKSDQPVAQALDSSGNLYVTGSTCNAGSTTQGCDYVTLKYDTTGALQWTGGALYDAGGVDRAAGIGLDGSGNVYVTGTSANPTSPGVDDIATVKYNASGAQQWVSRSATGSDGHAVAIAVDSVGDSYVTGWDYRGTGTGTPSIVTIKYASGGAELWQKSYDDGHTDMPVAIALDGGGNVYVTGKTGEVGDYKILTLKYLADGSSGWANTFGNTGRDDQPISVAVDAGGNAYVVGTLARSTGNTDIVTLRYNVSGTATNAITYDGYGGLADTPVAIALGVDSQGDTVPVVTGTSADSYGLDHIVTLRYEKALPDLTVTQIAGPSGGTVGSPITVSNTVLNIDDVAAKKHADSGSFDVGLYLAPDVGGAPQFSSMVLLGTRTVSNLTPGQTSADSTAVTIPSSVAEGTYYLVAVADPANTVVEQDETNNQLAASATIFVQGIKPDLAITSVTAPSTAIHGTNFDVTATVTDIVSTAVPSATTFTVGIYASSDATITTADTLLGSFTVSGGLAGFASSTQTVSVSVATAGQYYIGAIADSGNAVNEANEANNSGVNLSGTQYSTLLVTDADFVPGLSDPNTAGVSVVGTGNGARVVLAKSVVWSQYAAWNTPDIGSYAKPALGDLNGDGLPDVLIGDNSGVIHAYQNIGTVSNPVWDASTTPLAWNISSPCTTYGTGGYATPVLVDLDGDGDLDLLVGNRDGVCAYKNTGSKAAPSWQRQQSWDITGLSSNRFWDPAVADLNGDGKVDVILGWSSGITAYQNIGSTTSPAWQAAPAGWTQGLTVSAGERASPAMADLDGDGRPDLMLGTLGGAVRGYRNTGNLSGPLWAANTAWDIADPAFSSSVDAAGVALSDLDGDGDQDLLYGDLDGIAHAFQNIGTYATSPGTYYSKVVNAGSNSGYTTLSYTSTVPANTIFTVDVRAGDSTNTADGTWTGWLAGVADGGDISSLNNSGIHQYVQYRAHLSTSDNTATPSLFSIEAGTNPPPPQQTVVSVVGGNGGGGGMSILDLLAMSALVGLGRRRAAKRRS